MNLNDYATQSHQDNLKWWHPPGQPQIEATKLKRNKGELIALMHSELSEMLEGARKDKQDEHLPSEKSEHVELVDLLIRAFDYAGAHNIDIEAIYQAKRAYNLIRHDHTHEARRAAGGKKF
jgi:hypothetical protein